MPPKKQRASSTDLKKENQKKPEKVKKQKEEEEEEEEQVEEEQSQKQQKTQKGGKSKIKKVSKDEDQPKPQKAVKKAKGKAKKQEESDQDEEEKKSDNEAGESDEKTELQTNKDDILGDGKIDKKQIIIASWNINGLRAVEKNKDLTNYLKNQNPDILCLNELKVEQQKYNQEKLNQFIPAGYYAYMNFCKPPQQGYAGSAILSKYKPISVKYDIGKKKHDQEGRTITVEFETFFLVTCYVPNAGEGLKRLKYRTKEWDPDFKAYLNELKSKKHTVLCGDLNCAHHEIDIFNPKGNLKTAGFTVEERAEFTKLLDSGFVDTFRRKYPTKVEYSFWSYRSGARKTNKGWRLDYFLTDEEFFKNNVEDLIINDKIMGSDHCPIELKVKF